MAELNDKLITYGNLSTFYDNLQAQGLGGNAIEDASVLPDASENKNKLFRLDNGDKDVYVAKLISSENITTNRLPDAQQIDKAYLYDSDEERIAYYKGNWKISYNGGIIDGFGWKSDYLMIFSYNNAEKISMDTNAINIDSLTIDYTDYENGVTYVSDTLSEINDMTHTISEFEDYMFPLVPIPATYNAPESEQIGNAYITDSANVDTGIYNGTLVTFEDTQGSGEDVTGYKWTIEDSNESYIATSKPASEIYFYYDEDNDIYYTDATVWNVYYDIDSQKWKSEIAIIQSGNDSLYIPQLNAPDSEQVDNATIFYDDITYTYVGNETTITVDGETVDVYTWKDYLDFIGLYTSKPASEIVSIFNVDFYRDEDGIYKLNNEQILTLELGIVPWKRTETIEEWDWQPLTDNATNDDIDLMFANEIKLIRAQEDDENYIDWLVNTSGETMEFNGQTYYKWVVWGNDFNDGSGPAVEETNRIVLTNTLNVQLPFNLDSPEFEYMIMMDGEEMESQDYIHGDYTQKTVQ